MSEASWGGAATPAIDWRMSAVLANVPRGGEDLVEVTSLERAVRTWLMLDRAHRTAAILTPERALLLDGASLAELSGDGIAALAELLPDAGGGGFQPPDNDDADDAA